jgi:predicted ATPase
LVTVLGPAGVGKSRLVQEFIAAVQSQHPQIRVLQGRCLAAGQGITDWALGEILQAACGIRLDDPAAMAIEKLKAVVSDERTLEALAATAGFAVPGSRLSQLAPQAVADELAWAKTFRRCRFDRSPKGRAKSYSMLFLRLRTCQ